MSSVLSRIQIIMEANTANYNNELRRARENSSSTFGKIAKGAGKMALASGAAIVAVGASALRTAGSFEAAMNGVSAVSGATGEDFTRLRDLAKEMGSSTAFSATEAANGMEFLAMAGMNTEQVLSTIPNALNLAAAGSLDLASSADILSNIMTGMGLSAEESGRAADVLAQAASKSNVDIRMLGESMKYVAPISKQLGMSLEETTAMVGALGNAGIQGSEAGTALRSVYARFATHSKALGHFKDMGISIKDASGEMKSMTTLVGELAVGMKDMGADERLAVFKEMAGTEAMSALAVTVDAMADGSLPKLTKELESSEGAAKRMADTRMEGLEGAFKGLASAWEGFQIELADGGALTFASTAVNVLADGMRTLTQNLPEIIANFKQFVDNAGLVDLLTDAWDNLVSVIERAGEIIKPVIDFFREHDKLSEALAISIGLVAGAFIVYNAAVVVGTAVTGAFVAVLALVTSPIFLIVAAMIALTAAGVYLYQNWDEIKEKAAGLWDDLVGIWDGIVASVSDTVSALGEFLSSIWSSIVDGAISIWDGYIGFLSSFWGGVADMFMSGVNAVTAVVSTGWAGIVHAFQNPVETIKGVLSFLWEAFKTGAVAAFTTLVEVFVGGAIDLYKAVVQLKDDVISGFIGLKDGAIQAMISLKDGAINALINLKDGAIQAAIAIKDGVIAGFNAAVDGALFIWDAFKNGVLAVFNGIKAIIQAGMDAIKWMFDGGWLVILNVVKNTLITMVSVAKTAVTNLATAMFDGMVTAKNYVVTKVGEILTFFKELPSKMFNLGVDFIKGFANGIKSMASSVWDAAKDVAKGASNIVQVTIDSHSPSKVTHKLGQDFSKGMANGIKKGKKAVVTEAQKMAAEAVKAVKDGIQSLEKELALFGKNNRLAEFNYDVGIGKYKGAAQSDINKTRELLRALNIRNEEADVTKEMVSLQRSIYDASVLYSTELGRMNYELDDIHGKYKNINSEIKDSLRDEAAKLDAVKLRATAAKAMMDLDRQIALLGNDDLYSQLAYEMNEATGSLYALDDAMKEAWLSKAALLEQSKKEVVANESIGKSVSSINKELALMGDKTGIAELMYDLMNTDRYANASAESIESLVNAVTKLDNANRGQALTSVMDEIIQESPAAKIEADYQRRLEVLDDYESQWTALVGVHSAERAAIEQSYMDAKRNLMLTQGESLFGDLAGMAKSFAGEQSGIYRALFAVEKGFAIAQSAIAIQQSVAKAMALGFPQNIPVIAQTIGMGVSLLGNIKSIAMPVGQAHDGIANVPREGTWVLDKNERVVKADDNKKLSRFLDGNSKTGAASGNTNVIIHNYSGEKVTERRNDKGELELIIGQQIAKQLPNEINDPYSATTRALKANYHLQRDL